MMDKATDWMKDGGGRHTSDEDLLCLLDGELETRRAAEVREHLEACWSCRARSEKFQAAISSFVEYRQTVLKPSLKMPQGKSGFESRFRQTIAQQQSDSGFWGRWRVNAISRLRLFRRSGVSFSRRFFAAGKNNTFNFNRFRENLSPKTVANTVTASIVLASVLTVYLFWFAAIPTVSAEELLNRAETAYKNELQVNFQPVVYQQIQVSKFASAAENGANSAKTQPVKLELWRDAADSRMKQTITRVQANPTVAESGEKTSDTSADELTSILRANNFAPPAPLSVRGFRTWRNSLRQKRESVEELKGDGAQLLRLSIVVGSESENTNGAVPNRIENGRIVAASLTVRSTDFHPLRQTFRVATAGGGAEDYEVRETSFAVIDLASLSPGFFSDGETAQIPSVAAKQSPILAPSVSNNNTSVPNSNVAVNSAEQPATSANADTASAVADSDLEIEVINLLHSAGADTGEQIEVVRQLNGPVVVNGVVETGKRKNEILAALQSVQGNPAVRINVKTVAEAVAEQTRANSKSKKNNKNSSGAPVVQMEMREVEGKSFAAESDVRAYFSKQGAGDDAVKKYASGVVSRSNGAMRYAYALKRLKAQFTLEQLKNLKPEARVKWLNLVKSYASSYQKEINALKRELQPVFGGANDNGSASGIDSDAEIFAAIERMFAAGEASDRAVKAAFTTSDARGAGSSLKSAQFWNNLANSEVLARSLQTVK